MLPLLIALIVFVLAGLVGTTLLRRQSAARRDASLGPAYLAGLRWREFARLVLQAMQARGFVLVRSSQTSADGIPSDGSDILLEREGAHYLLSCKYGTAATVGAPALLGLAKSAQLRGAHSAIVVTPGRFDEGARRVADQQRIELIDGASLWQEVSPFIDAPSVSTTPSSQPADRSLVIAWLGAAAVAAVAWMLAQGLLPSAAAPQAIASTPATAQPVRQPAAAASPAAPAATEAVPTDPEQLQRRRVEAANAISTVAGVDRAIWSTQSTLLVHLASATADPSDQLCPLLERYPELAASRVQLQPPQGSDQPVRFKQCRSY